MKNKTYLTILLVSVLFLGISLNVYAKEHTLSFPAGESFIEQEIDALENEFSRLDQKRKKLVKEIEALKGRRRTHSSKTNIRVKKLQSQIVSLNFELRAYQERKENFASYREAMKQ